MTPFFKTRKQILPDSIAAIFLSASLISIPLQAHAQAVTDADGFSGYTFNDNSVNAPAARGADGQRQLPSKACQLSVQQEQLQRFFTLADVIDVTLDGGINGTTFRATPRRGTHQADFKIDGNLNGGVNQLTLPVTPPRQQPAAARRPAGL